MAQAPAPQDDWSTTLEELIVTGSSIRGVPPTGSNLIAVTREDIEAIGAANTPDLIATIPQLNSFNTAPQASLGGFGSFAPGMRGLPASATLPLMNGHRLVAAAANETNPDYPLIPGLALQRIEVVADGASSIYGSDAIAGVVNFITRKDFSGFELNASYADADKYHSGYIGALYGVDWGSGSLLAAYQYTENDNLLGGDRDYRVQDFRPWGGIDTRATSCPSPNVLANTSFWSAMQGAPGFTSANYCDNGAVADLLPSTRLHSLFVSGRQALGEHATLWAEVLYTDREDEIRVAPPAQTIFIFNTNPFFQGPAGASNEYVLFRPDNLIGSDHFTNTDERQVGNASFGIDYRLPRDLNLSVYGSQGWADND
ncbi:MAG TPA: TonB-dependent receptor plug domain-containing protein, partial [Caulobacter sp.]|nr:TonB-dependent receptor plug domain-containing protein [Caulobacter sp.]